MRSVIRPGVRRLFTLGTLGRGAARADIDAELDALIANRVDYLAQLGMSREDAEREALRRIGMTIADARRHLHQLAEQQERHMRLSDWIESVAADIRFAARGLARRPAFTVLAVATLAIGIGATTTIFSAVNALLLRPLPYAHPEELMKVSLVRPARERQPGSDRMEWSYLKFTAFRSLQHVFSDASPYMAAQFTVGTADVQRVAAEMVGATYLRTLGLRPMIGRDFDRSIDAAPGAPPQVILSYALWQHRFNGDPSVVGRTVDVNYRPYVIVGVAPRAFLGLTGEAQLFVPITTRPAAELNEPQWHEYWVVARRAPGVSTARAEAAVPILGRQVSDAYPNSMDKTPWGAVATPLDAVRLDPAVRRSLIVLFGAVVLVLLIACVNVANLLLSRANARAREVAVRLAIGASRSRLVRLLLVEGIVLSLLGSAAGLGVAWLGVRAIDSIDRASALRTSAESGVGAVALSSVDIDGRALAFTLALSVSVGVLFGLVPALGSTRQSPGETLKATGGRALGGASSAARRVLVVAQVALALTLLAGSGLMIRSLANLLSTDDGFDGSGVLTFRIAIPPSELATDSQPSFYDQVLARVRAIPGVTNASLSNCVPLGAGCSEGAIQFHDRPLVDVAHAPLAGVHWVTPDWFATLRIPVRSGRGIEAGDRAGAPLVTVVNETAAKKFWPNESPIGKFVTISMGGFKHVPVVGVVGNVRQQADSEAGPEVYVAFAQAPRPGMMVFVRTSRDPAAIGPEVRRAVREVAPRLPIYGMRTMRERTKAATAQSRFNTMVLTLFALTALVLAAIGIYGVMSLAVAARTREIGVRIALGADTRRVLRLVLGESAALTSAGALLGLAGAVAATRVLRSTLYELTPTDPITYAAIVVVLAAAALAASWLPARRAARVDPVIALRSE